MTYKHLLGLLVTLLALNFTAVAQSVEDIETETVEQVHEHWASFQPRFTEYICPYQSGLNYDPDEFICGYVLVPEDRTNPASRLIKLSVLQIISTSESPEAGAVIRLTGGPGGPSLSAGRIRAYQAPGTVFLREIADLIFFDQRGIGYSEGHFCRAVPDAYQYGLPITPDGENAYRAEMRKCLDEARAQHVAIDAYSTWQNALDVRDIRRALGYETWTLFGVSYGTELGQAVMQVDEAGIRAAVLDSVVPADPAIEGGWGSASGGFRSSLRAVSEACANHKACARDVGDLEARMEAAIRSYDETPEILDNVDIGKFQQGRIFLNGEMAANFVFQMLYRANLYQDMPILLDVLERHDGETMKLYANQASWPLDHRVGQGMRLIANCRGSATVTPERQAADEAAEPNFTRWLDLIDQTDDCRKVYGIKPDPAVKRLETDIPILIAAGLADPITPPHYSKSIMPTLPNAKYVEFPHTGHGALLTHLDGCGGEILAAFLKAPEAPLEIACAATIPAPDFLTRVHRTQGPYNVARGLQAGKYPLLPIIAALGLVITLIGFPLGSAARLVDKSPTRTVRGARKAAWLGAALSLAGLGTVIWYSVQTVTEHSMAFPIGVLPAAAIGGWLSLAGALLTLIGAVRMLRHRQFGQPGIGTMTGIILTALFATGLAIYLITLGFSPFGGGKCQT